MKPGIAARLAAARWLLRVLDEGAYSNVVVRTGKLPERDRGQAQRLLYTALRELRRVDRALEAHSSRPLDGIDAELRAVLRIGATDVLFLAAPPHAAVDGAVEVTREWVGPRATGFVNGVLRALSRNGEPPLPDGDEGRCLRLGAPEWMVASLDDALGRDATDAFFMASKEDPGIGIRVRRGDPDFPWEPVTGIPGAGYTRDAAAVSAAAAEGSIAVLDPASTAVGLVVAPTPAMTVLDAAAAPGGKTLHLWDQMHPGDVVGPHGLLVAADRHRRRIRSARHRLDAVGAHPHWVRADASRPPFRAEAFHRVLLDALCTGLGTLRRRPEIVHRLTPDAPRRMGAAQIAMALALAPLLAPGEQLVYSVCTPFREETVDVVQGVVTGLEERGIDVTVTVPTGLPAQPYGPGVLLGPHIGGTDGMFIATITRGVTE